MPYNAAPICLALGSTPAAKIAIFFMAHRSFDYNITEINNVTEVSRPAIYRALYKLLRFGIVKVRRHVGHVTFYAFNEENEVAKNLTKLNHSLVHVLAQEEIDKEAAHRANIESPFGASPA